MNSTKAVETSSHAVSPESTEPVSAVATAGNRSVATKRRNNE
jgi:hypothetical protein